MIITQENIHNNNIIINPNSKIKLLENQTQSALEEYYHQLECEFGCTYIVYIYEEMLSDKKIIYTSHEKWQDQLVGEKLINECPIYKAATKTLFSGERSVILPWNNIHCKTPLEKSITLFRSEFNIANGIGILHTNGIIREGIGLGADVNDFNFYLRILEDNLIYKILKKTRGLALAKNNFPIIH